MEIEDVFARHGIFLPCAVELSDPRLIGAMNEAEERELVGEGAYDEFTNAISCMVKPGEKVTQIYLSVMNFATDEVMN